MPAHLGQAVARGITYYPGRVLMVLDGHCVPATSVFPQEPRPGHQVSVFQKFGPVGPIGIGGRGTGWG